MDTDEAGIRVSRRQQERALLSWSGNQFLGNNLYGDEGLFGYISLFVHYLYPFLIYSLFIKGLVKLRTFLALLQLIFVMYDDVISKKMMTSAQKIIFFVKNIFLTYFPKSCEKISFLS